MDLIDKEDFLKYAPFLPLEVLPLVPHMKNFGPYPIRMFSTKLGQTLHTGSGVEYGNAYAGRTNLVGNSGSLEPSAQVS